tara:strand:+ start:284 stop:742 length:459 start_codon:yes stop_codon:yes gene_type:complete
MSSKKIQIFTDGACSGNPGPGGWGALIRTHDGEQELYGGAPETTNNRMEMQAAIEALRKIPAGSEVELCTDSNYLKDGMTSWLAKWKQNGWRTASKAPVKNQDLWQELDQLCAQHTLHWVWVKGHSGHPENERADTLARNAIVQLMMKTHTS